MHLFGHFRFTDFRETWQEYVNPCPGEIFRSEILKIVRCSKTNFSVASVNFGVNNLKTVRRRKRSPSKGTSLACPLSNNYHQSDRPKTYALRRSRRKPRALPLCQLPQPARPDRPDYTYTADLRLPAITTHRRFNCEQTRMHLRFLPTIGVFFGLRYSF